MIDLRLDAYACAFLRMPINTLFSAGQSGHLQIDLGWRSSSD